MKKRRAEADSNRGPSAYQPNALPLVSKEAVVNGWDIFGSQVSESSKPGHIN